MSVSSINIFSGMRRASLANTEWVLPNWNIIPSANMAALPREEIISKVKELAVSAANASTDKEKGRIQDQLQELNTQYISYVSPDRKLLYKQALKTIAKMVSREKKEEPCVNPQKTLIDILNEHDGIGLVVNKPYVIEGGGTVTAYHVTGGGFMFDVGYGGENVMSINVGCLLGNGVYYTPTLAEQARAREISDIFDRAYDYVKCKSMSTIHNPAVGADSENRINITI